MTRETERTSAPHGPGPILIGMMIATALAAAAALTMLSIDRTPDVAADHAGPRVALGA